MTYFAGLDVGVDATAICVVNSAGAAVLEASAETAADVIRQVLKGYTGRFRRVGHEAGPLSPWLQRGLRPAWLGGDAAGDPAPARRAERRAQQDRPQ